MPWLLYGKLANGDLLHVSEAARGEACLCYCPYCDRPLAAKKGSIKVHHFAHLEQTCAFVSAYDFFSVETEFEYSSRLLTNSLYNGLVEYAECKLKDMQEVHQALKKDLADNQVFYDALTKRAKEALKQLEFISQVNPRRKERSQVRQANYEVMQQLAAFIADHNAPIPEWDRVRDTEPCRYAVIYDNGKGQGRYDTKGWKYYGEYYPSQLWENPHFKYTPTWLAPVAVELSNTYSVLRRRVVTAIERLANFEAERERFNRFRLYFLLLEIPGQEAFFKIGITSRENIEDRIREIQGDIKKALGEMPQVQIVFQLSGFAFLESFFKAKYQAYQLGINVRTEYPVVPTKYLTEYFRFTDEKTLQAILADLKTLWYRTTDRTQKIKAAMKERKEQGKLIGRPTISESEETFLNKPKSQQIAALIKEGKSLREIERLTGYSINTVRKVDGLLKGQNDDLRLERPIWATVARPKIN